MKIHFWSSTEYSGFLEGLMRELNTHGFAVRQRFQISEVSYRAAKSPFARLWLRIRQYLVYPVQFIISLLWDRFRGQTSDVCVVSTNTFYVPLLATYLHPNVVYLVYDLFPEAMIYSGKWREGSLKVKCVRWITQKTLRRARQNVFLGLRLQHYVESQYGHLSNASVIEVGADQALFETVEGPNNKTPEKISILYCGNFGNLHDSATLFNLLKRITKTIKSNGTCKNDLCNRYQWIFHCSGPKRAELVEVRGNLPITLKESIQIGSGLGQADWISALKSAEIALVTMAPGSEAVVMPSKTYSAMMAGQAILAIAPEKSDLVDTIKKADCGWWVEPGNVASLEKTLLEIASNPSEISKKRARAHHYAKAHFGQDSLAEKWRALFDDL